MQGEYAEASFCEQFSISMPTLRITYDAKNQLRELLMNAGFSETSMVPEVFNLRVAVEPKLDLIVALLVLGHYPNICYHKEKRKVLTTDNRSALIHKTSVNCTNLPASNKFPSPFFVFGEKIRTRAVSCKQMSMISAVHILLFGCKRVELVNGVVQVDGWINLKMDPQVAANVVSLQVAVENVINDITNDPGLLTQPPDDLARIINTIKMICRFDNIVVDEENDGAAESLG
ncbi:hypothetical protein HPB50_026612 [Hyalomma asiaticum]|uniref:Uncharacterized protein n=1 Tax=Hyalomma asiaticum TaxID=266040 RepID=A0ACB7TRT8_HYAAI|nr:hypothetical protein HPB50_026612 [Hyalomma asiaticum]